ARGGAARRRAGGPLDAGASRRGFAVVIVEFLGGFFLVRAIEILSAEARLDASAVPCCRGANRRLPRVEEQPQACLEAEQRMHQEAERDRRALLVFQIAFGI